MAVIRAALKYRHQVREHGTHLGPTPTDGAGTHLGPTPRKPHNHAADPPPDPPGPTSAGQMGPTGGPVRDPVAPSPIPDEWNDLDGGAS